MTWLWDIDGLGTTDQTLRVFDPDGGEVASKSDSGFTWTGDRPDFVDETVAANDVQAALSGDIERDQP